MTKNRFWAALILCFILVVSAGCSGSGSSEENASPNKLTPDKANQTADPEIKPSGEVSISFYGSDNDLKRMKAIKSEFDKVHPEIALKLVQIPNDGYEQKMLSTMAAGKPYDLVQMNETFYSYAVKGQLEDLTPYIEKSGFKVDDYYKAAVDAYSYSGKVMGIPFRIGTMVLFYNKTLFDQANVAYPSDNWTWDDFLDASQKIANKEKGIWALPKIDTWWAFHQTFVRSNGGSMYNADQTQYTMDSPEAIKGLQLMQDLLNKYNVVPRSEQRAQGEDLWTSGKTAMMIDGPWWIIDSQKGIKNFDWDIAPVPVGTQAATPLFSNAFSIPTGSKNKEAAWVVMQFLASKAAMDVVAKEHADIPALISVAESDTYLNLEGKAPANFKSQLVSAERAFAPPITLKWEEINQVGNTYFAQILDQNKPVSEVIAKMKPEVDKLLKAGK